MKNLNLYHITCRIFFILILLLNSNPFSAQDFISFKKVDSISVYFDSGSAEINNSNLLIQFFNKTSILNGKIVLKGYTDTVGGLNYNRKLASNRLIHVCKIIDQTKMKSFEIDTININENYKSNENSMSKNRRVDIIVYQSETKIELNKPILLKINFEGGTANVLRESNKVLQELFQILKCDTTLKAKINGHVCCGPDQQLSLQRAKTVKKYLLLKGINGKRIICQGYSNTLPLVPETSDENMSINRRVEVVFFKD